MLDISQIANIIDKNKRNMTKYWTISNLIIQDKDKQMSYEQRIKLIIYIYLMFYGIYIEISNNRYNKLFHNVGQPELKPFDQVDICTITKNINKNDQTGGGQRYKINYN
jgi:hypothetical protein